jgi:hypothetical protein
VDFIFQRKLTASDNRGLPALGHNDTNTKNPARLACIA